MAEQLMCKKCKSMNVERVNVPTGIGPLNLPQCQDCKSIRITSNIIEIRKEKIKKIKRKKSVLYRARKYFQRRKLR